MSRTTVGSRGRTIRRRLPVRRVVSGRASKFNQGKQNHHDDLIERQTDQRNQRHSFCTLAARDVAGRGQAEPERASDEQDDD